MTLLGKSKPKLFWWALTFSSIAVSNASSTSDIVSTVKLFKTLSRSCSASELSSIILTALPSKTWFFNESEAATEINIKAAGMIKTNAIQIAPGTVAKTNCNPFSLIAVK